MFFLDNFFNNQRLNNPLCSNQRHGKAIRQSVTTLLAVTLVIPGLSLANPGHHDAMESKETQGHQENAAHQAKGHSSSGHAHTSWVEVPAAYQQISYEKWENAQAAARGAALFKQNCAACHGESGTGNGPAADSLAHPPADLTNHFHKVPGQGDAYLFWRISEGGQAEPFRSAGSAMPAFKKTLTEQQRWDVLTYVHQAFHDSGEDTHPEAAMNSGHGEMSHRQAHH